MRRKDGGTSRNRTTVPPGRAAWSTTTRSIVRRQGEPSISTTSGRYNFRKRCRSGSPDGSSTTTNAAKCSTRRKSNAPVIFPACGWSGGRLLLRFNQHRLAAGVNPTHDRIDDDYFVTAHFLAATECWGEDDLDWLLREANAMGLLREVSPGSGTFVLTARGVERLEAIAEGNPSSRQGFVVARRLDLGRLRPRHQARYRACGLRGAAHRRKGTQQQDRRRDHC